MARLSDIDPQKAKETILGYCKRKGALVAGVADLAMIEKIAPEGHRPRDIMPRVKSVISLGVGGQTQGSWNVAPKALTYFGSTERRGYGIAYGCAFFIENTFGARAIYCPPDMDPEAGPRTPLQDLKLHAELAGIGARSLAGDILLHPDYGYMYFASVFTELELPPDKPLEDNPCPAPSCVDMYRKIGRTPCMKFCPVQCLNGEIDAQGKQKVMRYDMAACAEMTQTYESVPAMLREAMDAGDATAREHALFNPENKTLWYKLAVGAGQLFAQCFECMRVCPIATQAPLADPIRRREAALAAQAAKPKAAE